MNHVTPVVRVLRNGSNYIAGFVLVLMSIGLFVLADPWMLWQFDGLDPSDRLTAAQSALATASLCLIASIGVTFIRLRVELTEGGRIAVHNPLCTWRFDRARIIAITGGVVAKVALDSGERIWLLPLENSLADRLKGRDRAVPIPATERHRTGVGGTDVRPRDTTKDFTAVLPICVPWILGAAACVVGLLVGSAR